MVTKVQFSIFSMLLVSSMGWGQEKIISMDELKKHKNETDCWMAVDGSVYDMSSYIKLHLEKCKQLNIVNLCGTDASDTWKKKESGDSPHKKKSLRNFMRVQIGKLSSLPSR